jgi:predicted nucleotidyltransferase
MYNPQILLEITDRIAKQYKDFKGSYLFGSRAKGTSYNESDYDIIVLFDMIDREKKSFVYRLIGEIEYKYDIFIDIKTLTPEQLNQNPFFYEEVMKYGKFFRAA